MTSSLGYFGLEYSTSVGLPFLFPYTFEQYNIEKLFDIFKNYSWHIQIHDIQKIGIFIINITHIITSSNFIFYFTEGNSAVF